MEPAGTGAPGLTGRGRESACVRGWERFWVRGWSKVMSLLSSCEDWAEGADAGCAVGTGRVGRGFALGEAGVVDDAALGADEGMSATIAGRGSVGSGFTEPTAQPPPMAATLMEPVISQVVSRGRPMATTSSVPDESNPAKG